MTELPMMARRTSTAAPILAALVIVLLPLRAYVGGCFWLGERLAYRAEQQVINGVNYRTSAYGVRVYDAPWEAALFWPAAKLESWLRGVKVKARSLEG